VKRCKLPTLSDHLRRCELYGVPKEAARLRFREFNVKGQRAHGHRFPGKAFAVSNIPIRVPTPFMGHDTALEAIEPAFKHNESHVAITALHGLRGRQDHTRRRLPALEAVMEWVRRAPDKPEELAHRCAVQTDDRFHTRSFEFLLSRLSYVFGRSSAVWAIPQPGLLITRSLSPLYWPNRNLRSVHPSKAKLILPMAERLTNRGLLIYPSKGPLIGLPFEDRSSPRPCVASISIP
jgi:hypothetical protein